MKQTYDLMPVQEICILAFTSGILPVLSLFNPFMCLLCKSKAHVL